MKQMSKEVQKETSTQRWVSAYKENVQTDNGGGEEGRGCRYKAHIQISPADTQEAHIVNWEQCQ